MQHLNSGSTDYKYDAGRCDSSDFSLLLAAALSFSFPLFAQQKVIVLGFDGVDARYTEQWMNEGKLPNLARLRRRGRSGRCGRPFRRRRRCRGRRSPPASIPAAPASSISFAAIRRRTCRSSPRSMRRRSRSSSARRTRSPPPRSPLVFALDRALLPPNRTRIVIVVIAIAAAAGAFVATKKYIPITRPGVINRRQGIPFWEAAANAGRKARVVHVPVTFPAHDFPMGEMLSGLGVPDVSGRVGKPFFFTSELDFHRSGGERVLDRRRAARGQQGRHPRRRSRARRTSCSARRRTSRSR